MSFIRKPKVAHSSALRNELGLTARDYEGGMSTLCAGCGHDSITAAIVQALWELSVVPKNLVKFSGIGCSSKTPAYFVSGAHGFNSVHGRMPSVVTGANAANRDLMYIGVSGDGDSLSIGLGQLSHAIRRNLNMLYMIENNGVYGLTKGQFSASSDVGSRAKKGDVNVQPPIDPVQLAVTLGATFVGRAFSGDKAQLVPLIKAALTHRGFALLDVISPCVTFNDHQGSTKSYRHTRQFYHPAVHADFVPPAETIEGETTPGKVVEMKLHDGSAIRVRAVDEDYDPTDRISAFNYLAEHAAKGEIVTGLLFLDEEKADMHEVNESADAALNTMPFDRLCPGSEKLGSILSRFR